MTFDSLQRRCRPQKFCKICCNKALLIVPVLSVRRTFSSWALLGVSAIHRLETPYQEECMGLLKCPVQVMTKKCLPIVKLSVTQKFLQGKSCFRLQNWSRSQFIFHKTSDFSMVRNLMIRKFTIWPGDPIHPRFLETFLGLWVLKGCGPVSFKIRLGTSDFSLFPSHKSNMSDEAYERFDFQTVGGNVVYRSGAAMINPLTGIWRRFPGRCVD